MTYLEKQCEAIIAVINRAIELKPHRLVGYAANFDYWVEEVHHCIRNLEGYMTRFERMKQATEAYIAGHPADTSGPYLGNDTGAFDSDTRTTRGLKNKQLTQLRQAVEEAAKRFLVRCYKTGVVDPAQLDEAAAKLGLEEV